MNLQKIASVIHTFPINYRESIRFLNGYLEPGARFWFGEGNFLYRKSIVCEAPAPCFLTSGHIMSDFWTFDFSEKQWIVDYNDKSIGLQDGREIITYENLTKISKSQYVTLAEELFSDAEFHLNDCVLAYDALILHMTDDISKIS